MGKSIDIKLALIIMVAFAMGERRMILAQDQVGAAGLVERPSADPLVRLQRRLDAAKTVQVDFLGRLTGPGDGAAFDFTGTTWLSHGDRARIDMKQGPAVTLSIITDGQSTAVLGNSERIRFGGHTYPRSYWMAWLTYSGPGLPILMGQLTELSGEEPVEEGAGGISRPPSKQQRDLLYIARDVEVGPDEGSWQYALGGACLSEPLQVTLWLDPDTSLPVKREVVLKPRDPLLNQKALVQTEYYANWRLNDPIEPNYFQIPERATPD